MKLNSFCIVCKKPARSPAGFSNVNKVTLCRSKKCRRFRKTVLQRNRRRQMMLKLDLPSQESNSQLKRRKLARQKKL
jgi:hypothetical protein